MQKTDVKTTTTKRKQMGLPVVVTMLDTSVMYPSRLQSAYEGAINPVKSLIA